MTRDEVIKMIRYILDNEILDIPNDYYIIQEHRENYAEFLLKKIESKVTIIFDKIDEKVKV